jgi:Holliday junction resolvase RusA-like endonuclease
MAGAAGMSGPLIVTLPYPPSVNRLWRRKRGGGMYKIAAATDFAWATAIRVYQRPNWQAFRRHPGPLCLRVLLCPPDARKHDVDNRIKCLQDALCAALECDDVVVREVHLYRGAIDRANPRAEVVVEALGGAAEAG